MNTAITRVNLLAALVAAVTLSAACGGSGDGDGPNTPAPSPTPSPAPGPAPSPTPSPSPSPAPAPAPSSDASSASCFNKSMFTVGSSWSTTMRSMQDQSTMTVNTRITGTTTFHGEPVLEASVTSPHPATQPSSQYISTSGNYRRLHGLKVVQDGQVVADSWYEPPLRHPINVNPGYSETLFTVNKDMKDGVEVHGYNYTVKTTYIGKETVTVPAGTFVACHFREDQSVDTQAYTTQQDDWVIGEGPYRGLTAKQATRFPGGTVQTSEATAFTADFK